MFQGANPEIFPDVIKNIEEKDYMLKLFVKKANIEKRHKTYVVTDIYEKSSPVQPENTNVTPESLDAEGSPICVRNFTVFNYNILTLSLYASASN